MSHRHLIYALLTTLIWGSNFVAIKLAFRDIPPFLFLTLRFTLCTIPLIFLLPRPKVPWFFLFQISLFLWIGQFSFLFLSMYLGMSAGLASLILQAQIIFTMLLSIIVHKYRPTMWQWGGVFIAMSGILLIANGAGSLITFLLMLGAAFCVSVANILFRRASEINITSVIVWSSLFVPVPMFTLSLCFEGWTTIVAAITNITFTGACAIAYTTWISTLVATSLWGVLLRQYIPSLVVPWALLVPIFGCLCGALFLREQLTFIELFASALVVMGLLINQGPQMFVRLLSALNSAKRVAPLLKQ